MRPRNWFLLAALFGAIGLIFVGCYSFSGSPRGYVSGHFPRAARYDSSTARAYTAKRPPTAVAATIADHWRPHGRIVNGTGVFLRYQNTMIVVRPRESHGSLITVDGFQHAYHHYYGIVGGYWSIHGGHGERFRGGGPGAGK
ncbi:MAG: DUF4247 domain-containing protein [Sciscionella sp.]